MAIEKVKRVWFLVENGELDPFVDALAESRTVHVIDLEAPSAGSEQAESGEEAPRSALAPPESTGLAEAEDKVTKLSRVANILDEFRPPKKPLHTLFVELPPEIPRDEFEREAGETDVDELYERVSDLNRKHGAEQKRIDELQARIDRLAPWAAATCPPPNLTRCRTDLGTVSGAGLTALEEAESDLFVAQPLKTAGSRTLVAVAWLPEENRAAREILDDAGFESLEIEPTDGTVDGVIEPLREQRAEADDRAGALAGEVREIAEQRRRAVTSALAHWQTEAAERRTFEKGLASKRIVLLSGYVRVREMPKLEQLLDERFPSVGMESDEPTMEEDVPVSLGGRKIYRPAQFLTSLFGLPDYFDFDPSPYIFFVFLLFFGFCFGDAIYGAALLGLGWWLARKARRHPPTAYFFTLMAWCGASALIFGVIGSAWLSDLFSEQYLGTGPIATALISMRETVALFDLMEQPMIGLGLALGIGVLIQFYGIGLFIYRRCRRGDYFSAFSDGVLWMFFLPGLMLMLGSVVADLPGLWFRIGLWTTLASAVGLVLTQGRHEESLPAKAITGLISLYGILGTYGATSFLSDALSYSRLLALGLATVVIGMAVNRISAMAFELPVVGIVALVVVFAGGHVINFLLCILSGFVHSLRLIFVEVFTRFYEGGGTPFAPLGMPESVHIIDESR